MEDLNSHGLHFDEFHKMRVLDPELASTTKDLKEECGTFLENMSDFRQMSDGFIAFSDKVSKSSKGGTPWSNGYHQHLGFMRSAVQILVHLF